MNGYFGPLFACCERQKTANSGLSTTSMRNEHAALTQGCTTQMVHHALSIRKPRSYIFQRRISVGRWVPSLNATKLPFQIPFARRAVSSSACARSASQNKSTAAEPGLCSGRINMTE